MIRTFLLLSASCMLSRASITPVAPPLQNQLLPAPVVTSASSQYFERIFNRLLFAPPVLEAPVIPFAPVAPVPAVGTLPAQTSPAAALPQPAAPENNQNVAIAFASAQAAPVATILLPPYPFGPPPSINFIPSVNVIPTDPPKRETEPTTERVRTTTPTTTALPQPSASPSNNNNFLQGLPSNENVKFSQYYTPTPQKVKTSVEVVPVPLAYIAPPPLKLHSLKHHFVPTKERIILRPVTSHNSVIRIKVPVRIVRLKPYYKHSHSSRKSGFRSLPLANGLGSRGFAEPTTLRPFNRPNGQPPRA